MSGGDHGHVVAAREAVVAPVLEGRQAFVGILGGLLQGIAARRKALGALEAQLHLEGRDRIAVADLVGLGRLPLVEQEQRHRQLITGIAELAGGRPGDPAQAEALRVGLQGDVWAGALAGDRERHAVALRGAQPELLVVAIGRGCVIPPGDGGLDGGALLQDEAQAQEEGNQLRRVLA